MSPISPEIVTDVVRMSVPLQVSGLLLGLALWLFGWRGHRFWIVSGTALAAGMLGLFSGRVLGVQLLVAGLLSALAAGLLAMELARVGAFLAGGVGAWLAVKAVVPAAQDPLVAFLLGGVIAVFLFRLWVMVLTSLAGTLLSCYTIFCLSARVLKFDPVEWAGTRSHWLTTVIVVGTLSGIVVQGLLDRSSSRKGENDKSGSAEKPTEDKHPTEHAAKAA